MLEPHRIAKLTSRICQRLVLAPILLMPALLQAQEQGAETTWDGLVAIENAESYSAFIDPDADFSVFRRVAILQPHVAFRSNWQRDQNRNRTRNIRAADVERIQDDVADLLVSVFAEQLEAAGYELVNYVDEDVLILRPAIIDLDVAAPDIRRSGRSRTYTATSSGATLFLEMFDAVSSDLIGRAVDRRSTRRSGGFATQANRVSNRSEARREFRVWADRLIEFLDQHYIQADTAE